MTLGVNYLGVQNPPLGAPVLKLLIKITNKDQISLSTGFDSLSSEIPV